MQINREHNEIFKGESASLKAILDTGTVRVPKVRLTGELPAAIFGGGSFLVLEHVYNRAIESSIKEQVRRAAKH